LTAIATGDNSMIARNFSSLARSAAFFSYLLQLDLDLSLRHQITACRWRRPLK
jgi:hypothetical protein